MPKSWQSGMKWVCTRPLVDRPQTKNVPNSSQKMRVREASARAATDRRATLPASARRGGAMTAVSPYGAMPSSPGWSRTISSTSTRQAPQAATAGMTAIRQPACWASQAAAGRNSNCPVAVLAASRPSTRPRRAVNQRLATVAPSTMAVMPVAKPTIRPQVSQSCQISVMNVASPSPAMMSASAVQTTARTP